MILVRTYDVASTPRGMLPHLKGLLGYPLLVWNNRYMVQNFLRRDLLSRVNGSFLGLGWLLLQPLFQFAIYFAVFGVLLGSQKIDQPPDPSFALHLFSGVIVFHALLEATSQSCGIVVDNGNLVKKVAFPSEVLPVHVAAVSLVIYLVGAAVCLVAGLVLGVLQPGWLLLTLPLVLAVQFTMTLGIGLFLANLHVFLRDTAQLWRIITMAWMFLSPVFWQPSLLVDKGVPEWFLAAMHYGNPAYPLLQVHRLMLGGPAEALGPFWPQFGVAAAWALGLLVLGYGLFMSRKHKFSDLI